MTDDAKEDQGPRSANAFPENDPAAAGVVGWEMMGARERLEACLAAVLVRWPLDPATFRYDPRRDVVYVLKENELDPKRARVSIRAVGSLHLSLGKLQAVLGVRATTVQKACAMRAERAFKLLGTLA